MVKGNQQGGGFLLQGTVVNIRTRTSADGGGPGIKVKLAASTDWFSFADVKPAMIGQDEDEGSSGEYGWEEGGLNSNPNTMQTRQVDVQGLSALAYNNRRPASASAAQPRQQDGRKALARPASAAAASGSGSRRQSSGARGRPASAGAVPRSSSGVGTASRPSSAGGGKREAMGGGGLAPRTWELALSQQAAGNGMLALGKGNQALADHRSLVTSYAQRPASAAPVMQRSPHRSASREREASSRSSDASAATASLSRSAFALEDGGTRSTLAAQRRRRPASAHSLRAAKNTWGPRRCASLTHVCRARGSAARSRKTSAWRWEDDMSALVRQREQAPWVNRW